ncbi:uncharacterized protein LOC134662714 [Cydia amplana]|uniref:uncharacterized protein LOC134662714 n=1 Tax=Cydia amplana TaxID=1869771 RepID=UPI002FE69D25
MPDQYDPNTLWVALNERGEGDIFHVYPRLLAELLLQEEAARQDGDTSEAERLVLPSDKEWRLQQYFLLVGMQKDLELENVLDESEKTPKPPEDPVDEWAPWRLVVSIKNPHAPPPVAVRSPPDGHAWDIAQVLKAAHLLSKPPKKVDFADEQQMRCVYSLIYDVFRYKSILEQAIQDIDFFGDFPEYANNHHTVWLFLMELTRRRWGARPRGEAERAARLLKEAGSPYQDIENTVWEQRVHFAAAIARIRIKNRAFSLSQLLPAHLKDEPLATCVNKESVTGWVNTFKATKVANLVMKLHELGYSYSGSRQLCAGEYRFDRVCPRFITLRPPADKTIGQLDLVKDGIIVLQEREFCEGASTLCRALRANSLRGVVAQTHASSPRCSAYLAAQLRELGAVLKASAPTAPATPQLGKLVVFGAGDKVSSYVGALRELGIEASEAPQSGAPVCVISEAVYCDTPVVTSALDGVVAVLATPPNSYSAVTDPIDLVCGRGGDLAMLEILTESEMDAKGRDRVQSILEEQKKTLKTLLSKPQIQLILYETHSALEAENQAQVTRAVAEANRLARERHVLLKKKPRDHHVYSSKKEVPEVASMASSCSLAMSHVATDRDHSVASHSRPASACTNSSRPPTASVLKKQTDRSEPGTRPGTTSKVRPIPETPVANVPRDPNDDNPDVYVPNCDLFEIQTLPNLGNGLDINYILDRDGCYLGLIQRKEITRLDAKYMIQVAEERGLFGAATPAPAQTRRKKADTSAPKRRRGKAGTFEVERINAPTYASLSRSSRRGSAAPGGAGPGAEPGPPRVCSRHERRQAAAGSAHCACDAGHRLYPSYRDRRMSAVAADPPSPPCRRPFPLVVHDVRLTRCSQDTLAPPPALDAPVRSILAHEKTYRNVFDY